MTALTAGMRLRIRRKTRPPEADVTSGELNITPFLDVVVNLVLFLLATTAAVLATSEIEARLPTVVPERPGIGRRSDGSLRLSVTLTSEGAMVSSRDGILASGCENVGPRGSIAVPPAVGGLDRAGLEHCAAVLHAGAPDERSVILTADPMVPYADVVTAMDALRGPDEARYFDDVLLSAGVR